MSVEACFSKAAFNYDNNCDLQLKIARKLLSMLDSNRNVIDLGCGTGMISKEILYDNLTLVDISAKMLNIAKDRFINKNNVDYINNDFDNIEGIKADLVFANMSLQWSKDITKTISIIRNCLTEEGKIAFSLPLEGTFFGKNIPTIDFLSFEQVLRVLKDWQIIHSSQEEISLTYPSLISALKAIKAMGANNCSKRSKHIISRSNLKHILVFNIGYFIAKKRNA